MFPDCLTQPLAQMLYLTVLINVRPMPAPSSSEALSRIPSGGPARRDFNALLIVPIPR